MPADDLYWNSIDFGSEEESLPESSLKNYVDPWDLENYAYIREHLDSIDLESEVSIDEGNSTPFYGPPQRDQNYAAIEEFRPPKPRPRSQQRYYDVVADRFDYEYNENPYEVNMKDISLFPYAPEYKDRRRYVPDPPPPRRRTSRDRSYSFSYGDYGTSHEVYSRLDDVYIKQDTTTLPIYYDVMSHKRRPTNFGLSNYGHLKIDYSYNWNKLDRYICN